MKRIIRSFLKVAVYLAATAAEGIFATAPVEFAAQAATPVTPVFYARRDYTGFLNSFVRVADTDGDGIRGKSAVYLGDGKGHFKAHVTLTGPNSYEGFNLLADINGDGILDVGILQGNTLAIYLGEGGATYAAPFSIGGTPYPGWILVENLHGQSKAAGLPDIVAPDTAGGVVVMPNLTQ